MTSTGMFGITAANVQSYPLMQQGAVLHDIRTIARQSSVIGWSELDPLRYKAALRSLPDSVWGHSIARPGDPWYGSPISWRRDTWSFVDGDCWQLHNGVSGVCGNRWFTWVRLEHDGSGARCIFTCKHYVPAAWPPPGTRPPPQFALRRRMWVAANERERDWTRRKVAHLGDPLCALGDYNRRASMRPRPLGDEVAGRNVRYPVPGHAIDYLAFINGDRWRWEIEQTDTLGGLFSDHDGRRARVRLGRHP